MEGVSAHVRRMARDALLGAGGGGFVRFAPPDGALLVTDAPRHCGQEGRHAQVVALQAAGFDCQESDGLLLLSPGDALLEALCGAERSVCVDWEAPLCTVQALAARFGRESRLPLTPAGRQLALEMLRLLWQEEKRVLKGVDLIRMRAAKMLRAGDRSGFGEAGSLLAAWCREREGAIKQNTGRNESK